MTQCHIKKPLNPCALWCLIPRGNLFRGVWSRGNSGSVLWIFGVGKWDKSSVYKWLGGPNPLCIYGLTPLCTRWSSPRCASGATHLYTIGLNPLYTSGLATRCTIGQTHCVQVAGYFVYKLAKSFVGCPLCEHGSWPHWAGLSVYEHLFEHPAGITRTRKEKGSLGSNKKWAKMYIIKSEKHYVDLIEHFVQQQADWAVAPGQVHSPPAQVRNLTYHCCQAYRA
jgi:hypothetical protein